MSSYSRSSTTVALSDISVDAIEVAIELLENPVAWTHRITDEYDMRGPGFVRSVTREITIPGPRQIEASLPSRVSAAQVADVVVPVLDVERGNLLDHLIVKSATGEQLMTLTYGEHQRLASMVLDSCFQEWHERLVNVDAAAARRLRVLLLSIPLLQPPDAIERYRDLFENPRISHPLLNELRSDPKLRNLSRFFSRRQLVLAFADKQPGDRVILVCEFDLPRRVSADSRLNRTKRWLGQKPVTFELAMPLAFRCQSYHLEIRCPEGRFVANHDLLTDIWVADNDENPTAFKKMRDQYSLPEGATSESNRVPEDGTTHTYFHGLGKSPTVPLYSRIKVLETPPGQTFRACVFALVQYGLLVTTGAFIDRLLSAQDLPMDLPALLLAVPGLVSVLMLPLSDSGLVALPLLTRVALMSNGFLSLASAVTYMILRSIYGAVPNGDSPPVPVWVVLLWLSMAAASAVVLLVTFHRLVETWREFRKAHVSLVVLPAST